MLNLTDPFGFVHDRVFLGIGDKLVRDLDRGIVLLPLLRRNESLGNGQPLLVVLGLLESVLAALVDLHYLIPLIRPCRIVLLLEVQLLQLIKLLLLPNHLIDLVLKPHESEVIRGFNVHDLPRVLHLLGDLRVLRKSRVLLHVRDVGYELDGLLRAHGFLNELLLGFLGENTEN